MDDNNRVRDPPHADMRINLAPMIRPVEVNECNIFMGLTRAQEVDDESEFSYVEDSENGPANWGKIKPEWKMCNSGTMQSPIDILNERVEVVSHLGRLHRDYKPSNATLINRGHDMMLRWEGGAGSIHINGTKYQLKQAHWHSPSEHTLNGKRFDMEVHLVHESMDNKTAVLGIMYKIGRPDSFLSVIKQDLEALVDTPNVERAVGIIDPKLIKFGSRKYYRYIGSLTVPPCTQNIIWTILRKVRTVTRKQVKLIREAVHDASETNARPIQPINERTVQLYKPRDHEN
ncbi:Alpha carbonic anhydrase 7 [Forsythia ovata]|uniref:Carbonic anhydrase n=1 Tax=Forsythia ovata TaxID=205694 RepID=A0ABD1RJZ4_9LAMI